MDKVPTNLTSEEIYMFFAIFIVRYSAIAQIKPCCLVILTPLRLYNVAIMVFSLTPPDSFITQSAYAILLLLCRMRIWGERFFQAILRLFFNARKWTWSLMLCQFLVHSELFLAPPFLELAVKLKTSQQANHCGWDFFKHRILLLAVWTCRVLHQPVTDTVSAW